MWFVVISRPWPSRKHNDSNDSSRSFALSSTEYLASSVNPTTPGSKSLEHRDDVISNSLEISGCGGRSMAMVYITSHPARNTTCCSNSAWELS